MSIAASRSWPKYRLQVRSVLSATMPIGWVWVAATALIPYFLIGRGRGSGSIEMFGIARTTWLSFHVWSSIVIGLLTIGHVILNRRGLTRSYRILSGNSHPAVAGNSEGKSDRRQLAWVAAVVLVALTIGGSWAYASSDERSPGPGSAVTQLDDGSRGNPGSGDGRVGEGHSHRGGRGG